jgi:uncharacterized protein with HEPN domain
MIGEASCSIPEEVKGNYPEVPFKNRVPSAKKVIREIRALL